MAQRIGRRRVIQVGMGLMGTAPMVGRHVSGSAGGHDVVRLQTYCLSDVPTGPDSYQQAFDYRRGGWAGADGADPIVLPDGRILWLFGDSLIGRIDKNNALQPGWSMVTSVQVQSKHGRCFTPVVRGTRDEPRTFFPTQNDQIFWPGGGFVDTSLDPPVLRIGASSVCRDEAGWWLCGNRIFTFSLPHFDVLSVDPVPYDPTVPGMPNFFGALTFIGGYAYMTGPDNAFNRGDRVDDFPRGLYIARASARDFVGGAWEYWDGDDWSSDVWAARPMEMDAPENPDDLAGGNNFVKWGSGYLMTGKMGYLWVFGTQVYAWYADDPQGPWRVVRTADGEPRDIIASHPGFPQGRWIYGGHLVTDVPGTSIDEPMVVFSTNGLGCGDDVECTPDNDIGLNVHLYGPYFVRPDGLPSPR